MVWVAGCHASRDGAEPLHACHSVARAGSWVLSWHGTGCTGAARPDLRHSRTALQGDVVVVADSASAAHGVNSVVLPVHSTAPGVAAGLANLTDVRRLHFPHPEHVWGGFGDNATEAAFDLRFHESLDSFCCWSRQGQATKASYAEFFYRTDEQALGLDA